jgi:putative sigma-54 modulation protein
MQINISGHHVEVSPALEAYVHKKLERIKHRSNNITSVTVILEIEKKYLQKAEATLHLSSSKSELHAEAQADDMYAAIDLMIDKLERQVTKHKEKLNHHAEGHHHADFNTDLNNEDEI